MMAKTLRNSRFLHSALGKFDSAAARDFFHGIGLATKVEDIGKVFPASEDARDVVAVMQNHLRRLNVQTEFGFKVRQNVPRGTFFDIVGDKTIRADAVIIATGGLSAPHTGSDGDGFRLAKALGHDVTKLYPALVPLVVDGDWIGSLMGLGVTAGLTAIVSGKTVYKGRGDVMFTHYGLSGPLVLEASAYLAAKIHLQPEICLDFMPDLAAKELDARILEVFGRNLNKAVANALDAEDLPARLVSVLLAALNIEADTKVRDVSKAERQNFCRNVKEFRMKISGSAGFGAAVITCGGVDVRQINPATMESKIVPGLYFAGEVLDVDALTGGYNLQIAFATGHLAGQSAAKGCL